MSASRRPPRLQDRLPELNSLRPEIRRQQRRCFFPPESKPSLSGGRRSQHRSRVGEQPAGLLQFSFHFPGPRQAANQVPPLAISVLVYVRAMAARRAPGRSDRQTQTQPRKQRSKTSSRLSELNLNGHSRGVLHGQLMKTGSQEPDKWLQPFLEFSFAQC
jgi:hypothetical protein